MDLGFGRDQFGEDAPETKRVLAKLRPDPVVAGGRGVALVEHEVDHLEDRSQTFAELRAVRNLERDVGLRERSFGSHDALRDGRLPYEKRACDLVGCQTTEQTQREGDPGFSRQHGMARHEDEAQQVVADVVVEGGVQVDFGQLVAVFALAYEVCLFAFECGSAAQEIDRTMFRSGGEPGTRVVRDT